MERFTEAVRRNARVMDGRSEEVRGGSSGGRDGLAAAVGRRNDRCGPRPLIASLSPVRRPGSAEVLPAHRCSRGMHALLRQRHCGNEAETRHCLRLQAAHHDHRHAASASARHRSSCHRISAAVVAHDARVHPLTARLATPVPAICMLADGCASLAIRSALPACGSARPTMPAPWRAACASGQRSRTCSLWRAAWPRMSRFTAGASSALSPRPSGVRGICSTSCTSTPPSGSFTSCAPRAAARRRSHTLRRLTS